MVDTFLERLRVWATQRNILLALALFLVINAAILPVAGARIETLSDGVGPLDLRPGFTAADAYTALAAYGDEGRRFYLLIALTVDMLYPVVYAFFLSLTIVFGLRPVLPAGHVLHRAALLPWVAMAADYVENAGIIWLLLNFPNRLDGLAAFTGTVTLVKWLFAISAMAATAAALVALVIRRLRTRGTAGA